MKGPLHRPLLSACWCKNNHARCYKPPWWPLFSWREDSYRTHDRWVFIKPRPCLNSFKQVHYRVASQTGSLPTSQPVHFNLQLQRWMGGKAKQKADRRLGSRHGVSGEFLAQDRIPESIYFHSRLLGLYRGSGHSVERAACWWITSGSVHHKTEGWDINTARKDDRVSI